MKRYFVALFSLLVLVLACGAPTPVPSPAGLPTTMVTRPAIAVPLAATAVTFDPISDPAGASFAAYTPNLVDVNPAASDFSPTLAGLQNPEALQGLTLSQQAQLAADGFLIVPEAEANPLDIYAQAGAAGQPIYVTTDLLLYAVHNLTSIAIQQTERDHLAADLLSLSEALLAETDRQVNTANDAAVGQAALENLAYFGVGLQLQDRNAFLPPEVTGRVADELTLISRADGLYFSPLRGGETDYTVYAPAGAAVEDTLIRGYRQAAAWYAQSSLPVGDPDPAVSRPAARQLLLLLHALENTQNLSRWDRVYATQAYLAGTDQAPSVLAARALAEAVYGTVPGPAALPVEAALDSFIATWQATWGEQPFRLLPQPTRPDTPIFPALVFDRVGRFQGEEAEPPPTAQESNLGFIRARPTGLDVAATLGSEVALGYLLESGDALYDSYDTQLSGLRAGYATAPEAAWTQTRPAASLYTLQALLPNDSAGLPAFMTQPAWARRQLNSWYGGWAMLRHEPVWVSRPVSTIPQPAPGGYVDPAPLFFARQAAQVRQLALGLDSRGLLDQEMGDRLLELARILDGLKEIARHELEGSTLLDEEQVEIWRLSGRLARLLEVSGPAGPLGPPPPAFVVDVYQNAQNNRVLQAALGEVWPMYVIIPGVNGPVLVVGAVFSTYEFGRTATEKWTNTDWISGAEGGEPAGWLQSILP